MCCRDGWRTASHRLNQPMAHPDSANRSLAAQKDKPAGGKSKCVAWDMSRVGTATQRTLHRIEEVATILSGHYGDFEHFNQSDPLDELIFITCSTCTLERNYLKTFEALKTKFPTPRQLSSAPVSEIAVPLLTGGLALQKATAIRQMCDAIIARFGRLTLTPLQSMSDSDCEAFLLSLPRVGRKVARCVMMYSLRRQVFPVDTHCWRISRRLGWIRSSGTKSATHPSNRDMDRLQEKLRPELRLPLHIGMVSHGRVYCTAFSPKCINCPVRHICPKIGVARLPKHKN